MGLLDFSCEYGLFKNAAIYNYTVINMTVTQIWIWPSLSSNHSDQNELVVETMQGNILCKVQIQQNTNPNYIRLSGVLPKHLILLFGDEVTCAIGEFHVFVARI